MPQPRSKVDDHQRESVGGRSSPHPFIAWIPLAGSLLLPLLISALLFLLLDTTPSPVFESLPHPSFAHTVRVGRCLASWCP